MAKPLEKRDAPWLKKRPRGASLAVVPKVEAAPVEVPTTLPDPPAEIRVEMPLQEAVEVVSPAIIPKPAKPKTTRIRPGRRPDYTHALIGLSIGDKLIFHKSPSIEATVADDKNGMELNGTTYNGIDYAAQEAYKIAGIQPPKKVNGLADWRDSTGVRLRELYHQVPPLPPTITVS
jgi:hypothetical protein